MQHCTGLIADVGQTLILPLFSGLEKVPNTSLRSLHRSVQGLVKASILSGDFKGGVDEELSIWSTHQKVLLIGVGDQEELTTKAARDIGAKTFSRLHKSHGKTLTVRFTTGWKVDHMIAFAEGMMLRDYKFDKYLSKDETKEDADSTPYRTEFQTSSVNQVQLREGCCRAAGIAKGVHTARDLANEPGNKLYPMEYAARAIAWKKGKQRVKVTVYDWDELHEQGMGGLINVGKGSEHKPCMVIWELNRTSPNVTCPVIVGKGITFDTGGISIKPSSDMGDMKFDMHGSATVFGAMVALDEIGYTGPVVGISCMAENTPSRTAYRPGDIIPTYSGKTVEIMNTDAEGRLVLADGLSKAGEFKPEYIVDLATLTGACVVALGHEATGLWSNDNTLREKLRTAAKFVGELAWPMPLLPAYEQQVTSSKIADLKNTGERYGGANSAAAFLKQFIPNKDNSDNGTEKQYPWAHLDIAGTAWGVKTNVLVPYGATGVHVRTLVKLITGD